jgi:hypothetical protein
MLLARHLSRRWVVLALALFAVVAAAVGALFASWSTESAERVAYERIETGMDRDQVWEIMHGRLPEALEGTLHWHCEEWRAPNGAVTIVYFDSDLKVTDKRFREGDQSLWGKAKRLAGHVYSP